MNEGKIPIHGHIFNKIGGGCLMNDAAMLNNEPCDTEYRCACGARFKTREDKEVHFRLPDIIISKPPPEDIEINFDESLSQ